MKIKVNSVFASQAYEVNYLDIYKLYREDMIREDELINQRLGWLLASNGFLLAGLTQIFDKKNYLLILSISVLSLLITVFMSISIWGARRRVKQLDKFLNTLHKTYEMPSSIFPRAYKPEIFNKGKEKVYWGLVAPLWVPLTFIVCWIIIVSYFTIECCKSNTFFKKQENSSPLCQSFCNSEMEFIGHP